MKRNSGKPPRKPDSPDAAVLTSAARLHGGEFTALQLLAMIAHGTRLEEAMPVALDLLEREPFTTAQHYPGDLLRAVLSARPMFWKENEALYQRCSVLLDRLRKSIVIIEKAAAEFEGPQSSPWHP